jgi:hypothetical protein
MTDYTILFFWDEDTCFCPAQRGGGKHLKRDHDSDCLGQTVDGPPCGGCYRCIAEQVMYYEYLDRVHAQEEVEQSARQATE